MSRHDGESPASSHHRRLAKSQERPLKALTEEVATADSSFRQLMRKYDLQLHLHPAVSLHIGRVRRKEVFLAAGSERMSHCTGNCDKNWSRSSNKKSACANNVKSNCSSCECIHSGQCSDTRHISFAIRNRNISNNDNSDSESEILYSGFHEGCMDMDLDAIKSAISRLSIYEEAFFNEGAEADSYYEQAMQTTGPSLIVSHDYTGMTELHLALDQMDGSEIISPSRNVELPLSCLVSARFHGYSRRHWLASGSAAALAASEAGDMEFCFHGDSDCGRQLLLRLSFQPEVTWDRDKEFSATPSTGLVLKLSRLAFNLRRFMFSRRRYGAKQKKS